MPKLTIDVEARIAQATDSISKLTRTVESSVSQMQRSFGKLNNVLGTFGLAFGAAQIVDFVRASTEAVAALDRVSQATGFTAKTLGLLKIGAFQADVSFEELSASLAKFNKHVAEGGQIFKVLGIDMAKLKTPEDKLLALAKRFSELEASENKTALAMLAFGRGGANMINFLNDLGQGIGKLDQRAKELGFDFGDKAVQNAKQFEESTKDLKLALEALAQTIGTDVAPAVTRMIAEFIKGREIFGSFSTAFVQIGLKTDPFESFHDNILTAERELRRFDKALKEVRGASGPERAFLDIFGGAQFNEKELIEQRKLVEKRIEYLKFQQQQRALEGVRPGDYFDPRDVMARGRPKALEKAPALPDKESEGKIQARLDALARELQALDKITEATKVLEDIEKGRLGKVTQAQKFQLLAAAGILDQRRQQIANEKDLAQAAERRLDALHDADVEANKQLQDLTPAYEQQAQALRDLADPMREVARNLADIDFLKAELGAKALTPEIEKILRDMYELRAIDLKYAGPAEQFLNAIDPAREYRIELEKIDALEKQKQLGPDEAAQARAITLRKIDTADSDLEHIRDMVDPTRELRRELEIVDEKFRQGFIDPEQAAAARTIINRDIVETLAAAGDMAAQTQLVFEDALVDPFVDLVSGVKSADDALKDFFGNIAQSLLRLTAQRISSSLFTGLFGIGVTSAKGNVMTDSGPMHLERFARGGIARRPMLSIFGEGRMPEAYVPLPDGRSIPVQMRGQDGGRLMAGPSALMQRQPAPSANVTLQLHPNAMHMTMRDWFEGEMAREMATR